MKAKEMKAKGLRFCAKCWRSIPKGRCCVVKGTKTFCAECGEKIK